MGGQVRAFEYNSRHQMVRYGIEWNIRTRQGIVRQGEGKAE